MSLLDEEQRAGVLAQLQGVEPPPPEAPEPQLDEADGNQGEEAAEMQHEEEDEPSGHAVPYSRFSQVIAARNTLAEQNESYEARVSELEEKLSSMKGLKELLGQSEQTEQHEVYEEEVSELDGLRSAISQISEQQQFQILEKELAQANASFPAVSSEYLLQAVIEDPSTDVMEAAASYSQHISEIEEGAIARYLETQKAEAAQPDVPPELSNSGRPQGAKVGGKSGGTSIRDVTEFLLKKGF
jgi:hypothetical protein